MTATDRSRGDRARWVLAAVLAVAVVLAAVVLVRMLAADPDRGVPVADSAASEQAYATSEAARASARGAASQATVRVLSYSWQTLDADLESARAVTTGEMREQYDDTMAEIEARTVEDQVVVEATVVAAGVVSATERDAKVLLFVDQSTSGKHLDRPRTDRNRVVVTLHRDTGGWMITELDAL